MRHDLEQEAQMESIKAFWKQYRLIIIGSILAVILASVGWVIAQQQRASSQASANLLLDAVEQAVAKGDPGPALAGATQLAEQHADSLQAGLAALATTRLLSEKGPEDAAKAVDLLKQSIGQQEPAMDWLLRLQAAAILQDLNRPAEGLEVLKPEPPVGYVAVVQDRRGDLHAQAGEADKARAAWTDAQTRYRAMGQEGSRGLTLVERKLATHTLWSDAPAAAVPAIKE